MGAMPTALGGHANRDPNHAHAKPWAWHPGVLCGSILLYASAISSIFFHSAGGQGMTERREMRTSSQSLNALSALIAASGTGVANRFTNVTSTTTPFSL